MELLKDIFKIKNNPLPLLKAFFAGMVSSLPVFFGILFGNFQYGLIAGIGGFAYLYVFNEPYVQRAKKILMVAIGLSVSMGLGILFAPHPILFPVVMGIIGAVITYIFGTLKLPGPAAIFFIIVYSMTSAMNLDPSQAPIFVGLVLLGGLNAWVVSLLGWFVKPFIPETVAVKKLYIELAQLASSVGTDEFNQVRARALSALKGAESTLLAGYISWHSSKRFKQLYLLKDMAHSIWAGILEIVVEGKKKLPVEISDSLLALAHSLDKMKVEPVKILQPETDDKAIEHLFTKIYDAEAILNEPESKLNKELKIIKPNLRETFSASFDKSSIVFTSSLNYGFVLMISAFIAFAFDFERSYWIPVSCASVMLGSTVLSTFHRAIQRSIGTIMGLLIAIVLLMTQPNPLLVALYIGILNFITETFIVRNYVFACIFLTPTSLLIAENTTRLHDPFYFATVRITDIVVGCAIGLLGVLLISRKTASSRLPHMMAKTIRSQAQLFHLLFSKPTYKKVFLNNRYQKKLRTNMANLNTVYMTALGELSRDRKSVDYLSPATFSIEQLGYLLDSVAKKENRPMLSDGKKAECMLIFESMAKSIEQKGLVHEKREIPELSTFPLISKEINNMQKAVQIIRH